MDNLIVDAPRPLAGRRQLPRPGLFVCANNYRPALAPETAKPPGTEVPGDSHRGNYRRRAAPHQMTTRPARMPTARPGDANASAVRARPGSYVGAITGRSVVGRVGLVAGRTIVPRSIQTRRTTATRMLCKCLATVRVSLV